MLEFMLVLGRQGIVTIVLSSDPEVVRTLCLLRPRGSVPSNPPDRLSEEGDGGAVRGVSGVWTFQRRHRLNIGVAVRLIDR